MAPTPADDALTRCAAVFLPGRLPREGRVAFWHPDGTGPPGADAELTVARRHGNGARSRTVPAVILPVAAALPPLTRA
ncbi:hypothetical protein, partial [Streptomyces meridianus]